MSALKDKYLLLVLLLAFTLRALGTNFGLPNYFFNSDENEYVSAVEALVIDTQSPYKTGLPINIFYYILLGLYYIFHFWREIHLDPNFVLFARGFSALLSTGSVFLVYLMGKNLIGRKAGLLSALTLAVLPVDVHIGHYIKEDVYIQFFGMLGLYFLLELHLKKHIKYALLSAIFCAIAGSAKLNGFFYCLPVVIYLALLDSQGIPNIRHILQINKFKGLLALLLFSCAFLYIISTPISFMESGSTKKYSIAALLSPEHEVTSMSSAQDGMPNILWWFLYMFSFGGGYLITLLFITSYLTVFKTHKKNLWPFYIFSTFYLLILFTQSQRFDRWITMVSPLLALYLGIYLTIDHAKSLKKIIWGVFWLGILYNLVISLNLSVVLAKEDTRSKLANYIIENISKDNILYFQEAQDPLKHYLNSLGYTIYDYSCRSELRKIDLTTMNNIYIITNKTLSDISKRFPGSDFEKYTYKCEQYAATNSNLVKSFEENQLDNNFYGFDFIVGPATARYLHSPKVQLLRSVDKTSSFRYEYGAEKAKEYSTNLTLENDYLVYKSEKEGSIRGPYIAVPKGKYKLSIDYEFAEEVTVTETSLVFGIQGKDINPNLEKNVIQSKFSPNTVNFEIEKDTIVQFPVVFTGIRSIKFNSITLEEIL